MLNHAFMARNTVKYRSAASNLLGMRCLVAKVRPLKPKLNGECMSSKGTGKVNRKVVISGMLGNGLEWYDYALYGHMSLTFATLFFPTKDASFSLILTFLTFAVGFISRPLGAILFGYIGDKFGRKKALVASMILMAIPTGCIGLLPTYQMVGVMAPILLLLIRILQGLSLGGAFAGSMSYVVEHAPPNRRAAIGSVTMLSLVIGFLFGSLVSTITASSMSEADFQSWGWRLPFFVGVLIGFVGFYIRNHGEESPIYEEAKSSGSLSDTPVKDAFTKHPVKMLQGFIAYLFVTVPFYSIAIYMIAYSKAHLGLTQDAALKINSLAMVAMFIPIWPMANLADRIGRKKVLLSAIVAMGIMIVPSFDWMLQGKALAEAGDMDGAFIKIAMGQMTLAFISGWYIATIPALLVEMFPTRIRYTGMALSYNFCAILGGFTPAIAEALIKETGSPGSIMYLLIGAGVISFISMALYRDKYQEALS